MRKAIVLLMSLLMICCMASCSMSDYTTEESSEESATVTGSGNEYLATVDQDSLSCSVEYLGTQLDVDGEDTVMAELTFPSSET